MRAPSTTDGHVARDLVHEGRCLAPAAGGWAVIDCVACGFAHLDPLPPADELRETYRRHYYESVKPDYLAKEADEQGYWLLEHDDKLDALRALRGGSGGPGRLLDIGCSGGFFIAHAAARGWQVLGIEPSAQAAAHARGMGMPVIERFLDELDWDALGTFDAVHLKLVLEHLPDPAGVLATVAERLRPGGVVCVQVPNDFNLLQGIVRATIPGTPAWWVAPPYHVNYFSFESLERLLARVGLRPLRRDTNFPMEVFLLMGDHYVGDETVGRACHHRRMTLEQRLAAGGQNTLRRRLYAELAGAGLGREAIVYARREGT
jgi:SAM-dependent methyltransferase